MPQRSRLVENQEPRDEEAADHKKELNAIATIIDLLPAMSDEDNQKCQEAQAIQLTPMIVRVARSGKGPLWGEHGIGRCAVSCADRGGLGCELPSDDVRRSAHGILLGGDPGVWCLAAGFCPRGQKPAAKHQTDSTGS
jgi:hypothetical protein